MGRLTSKWLAIGSAVALSFAVIACTGVASEGVEGTDNSGAALAAGENAGTEGTGGHDEGGEGEGSEGVGEHNEGSEGEGSEGADEHSEGGRAERSGDHGASEGGEEGEGEHGEEGEGEHGEEGDHGEGEEGEESGTYIARNETWDRTRRGARLVLTFNAERNAFVGTVENMTEQTLCAVRVEVHLGGGTELGPTTRTDVPSGGTIDVELPTEGAGFETWTAHPELSACGAGS